MDIKHLNPDTLHKNAAFTQVITVSNAAKLIFVGGQNSVDAQGNVVGDDIATQTKQSLQNVVAALEAAGATLQDVVSMKLYVVPNQSLHAGFGAFQGMQNDGAKPPTISVLIVAGLANPDFLIEIEAIAAVGAGGGRMSSDTPVGKTKGQGWEIGVRRTFQITVEQGWELLMTQPGLGYWLGHGVELDFKKGAEFETKEGTVGEIRSYSEGSLLRMRWQPPEWDFTSTLQLRVQPAKRGTTISFHHEKLKNGDQREQMQRHWSAVLDKLEALIEEA